MLRFLGGVLFLNRIVYLVNQFCGIGELRSVKSQNFISFNRIVYLVNQFCFLSMAGLVNEVRNFSGFGCSCCLVFRFGWISFWVVQRYICSPLPTSQVPWVRLGDFKSKMIFHIHEWWVFG